MRGVAPNSKQAVLVFMIQGLCMKKMSSGQMSCVVMMHVWLDQNCGMSSVCQMTPSERSAEIAQIFQMRA
jgi:hypothetical protein